MKSTTSFGLKSWTYFLCISGASFLNLMWPRGCYVVFENLREVLTVKYFLASETLLKVEDVPPLLCFTLLCCGSLGWKYGTEPNVCCLSILSYPTSVVWSPLKELIPSLTRGSTVWNLLCADSFFRRSQTLTCGSVASLMTLPESMLCN